MQANLSIWGMYQYDETLFDGLELPPSVDKPTLVENLVIELSELELLYSSAPFLKQAISSWSRKELPVWNKLAATMNLDYNPIYNYDRTEEWADDETRDLKGSSKATGKATEKVSGFNDAALVENSQTLSESGADSSNSGTVSNKRKGRAFGNIGVTTTQEMIEHERRVSQYNLIDEIINSFKYRFCILVY